MGPSQLTSPTSLQTCNGVTCCFHLLFRTYGRFCAALRVWDQGWGWWWEITSKLSFPFAKNCIRDAWGALWSLSPFTSLSSSGCRFLQCSFIMNSAASWKWSMLGCTRMVVSVWITFGEVLMRGDRAIREASGFGEELCFSWAHLMPRTDSDHIMQLKSKVQEVSSCAALGLWSIQESLLHIPFTAGVTSLLTHLHHPTRNKSGLHKPRASLTKYNSR